MNEETVELVCEGLDTLSEIKINGVSVAKTSDMHRTYRFPVKKYLKQGENTIEIRSRCRCKTCWHHLYQKL